MGWLPRAKGSTDDAGPGDEAGSTTPDTAPATAASSPPPAGVGSYPPPQGPPVVPAAPAAEGAGAGPTGRYGPLVSVTGFDLAPSELEWQLPLNGELYRLMPGSDRPDYSLLVLERPVHFYPKDGFDLGRVEPEQRVHDRRGRQMVRVHALLLCARFVGQQLHPGMKDLAVNLAYVIDNSLARDAVVDFGKIDFAGVGFLSEGHQPRAASAEPVPATPSEAPEVPEPQQANATAAPSTAPSAPEPSALEPSALEPTDAADATRRVGALLDGVARTLHAGVVAARGTGVEHLAATITVGPDHRLTGLSGNADGQAPVPTPETFEQVNAALAGLADLGPAGRVASVSLRVEGGVASHEVSTTHG